MTADAFISIRNVHKFFGSFQAIDDVSIDIAKGEFFSLLGASGCGKTTLLRMLAGFEGTSSGEIYIDGQPMSDVPVGLPEFLRLRSICFQQLACVAFLKPIQGMRDWTPI